MDNIRNGTEDKLSIPTKMLDSESMTTINNSREGLQSNSALNRTEQL